MTLLKLSFTRHLLEQEREAIKADIAWGKPLWAELAANTLKLNEICNSMRAIAAERNPG